jgi:Ribbon-helix-helix domain
MMYYIYIMQTTALARTQIYLTQTQQKRLAAACRRTAVTKSELIRQAVDQFLDQQTTAPRSDKLARVQGIAGLWADRTDLADPTAYVRTLRAPRF